MHNYQVSLGRNTDKNEVIPHSDLLAFRSLLGGGMDGPPAGFSCDLQRDLDYDSLHQPVWDIKNSAFYGPTCGIFLQAHIKSQFVRQRARSSQTAQVLQHKRKDGSWHVLQTIQWVTFWLYWMNVLTILEWVCFRRIAWPYRRVRWPPPCDDWKR